MCMRSLTNLNLELLAFGDLVGACPNRQLMASNNYFNRRLDSPCFEYDVGKDSVVHQSSRFAAIVRHYVSTC